jgi:hypothetical protein
MAASRGVDNWNDNFKGQGDVSTVAKVDTGILYEENGNRLTQQLTRGTPVTYIDSQSKSHTRVAIRVGQDIFFTNVDNLVKPKSLGVVNLKPQAFGLGAPLSLTSYVTTLKTSIKNRGDIKGELQEYLLDLVDYVSSGSGGLVGYKFTELPMASIRNDFGEAIGPIFCLKSGLINKNLGINASSTVSFPGSGSAQLLDYIISTSTKQIKVSAKSKGTANTLKMTSLVSQVNPKFQSTTEFQLMSTINSNSMNMGPIQGCALVGVISRQAAGSVGGLRGNDAVISDVSKQLFANLIMNDSELRNRKTITLRNIAYVCEKKLVEYSKKSMVSKKFTEIVKDILDNEIFYVKLDIDNGIPRFNVASTSDRTISNLVLRNKNSYNRPSDKLGFKV